ncbi:MAG: patatin-like phospholipase family protein [Terriglobales bacterium]
MSNSVTSPILSASPDSPAPSSSPTRPRRLLSIDGGGLCGIIPAQALMEIEKQLDDLTGDPQPLCNRFDLIGGTSTGAILAVGLAMGYSAEQMRDFYLNFGPDIFTKVFWPLRYWHKYPSAPIEEHLKEKFGATTTLGDPSLRTKVLLVAKNATLGNDWFFTNNPKNVFFPHNKQIPLWHIVRASTAAPTYFPPHAFAVPDKTGQPHTYEFIDGGVSSYNNPSLQVFLETTAPEYGIGWPTGVDNLLLMSLGTGYSSVAIQEGKAAHYNLLCWVGYMLKELMNEANLQQNVLLHLIGQRPAPGPDDSLEAEISKTPAGTPSESALTHVSDGLAATKLLTYQRITIELTRERLDKLGLTDIDPVKVREMDAVDQIPNMQRVGKAVAAEQVRMARLIRFFPKSLSSGTSR